MNIEFVSYDGEYPNLCSGTLTMKIDGKLETDFVLRSNGNVWFDKDWCEHVDSGEWSVECPKNFTPEMVARVEELVNANVNWGCCGGCV